MRCKALKQQMNRLRYNILMDALAFILAAILSMSLLSGNFSDATMTSVSQLCAPNMVNLLG